MKKYVFRPYEPVFAKLFETEANRVKKLLGEDDLIEHVGSTAVRGLGGKGIIDIFIAVNKRDLKFFSKKLQEIGYEFGPKGGSKERLFHKILLQDRAKNIRTYHVHVTFKESREWNDTIKFRDYLRAHPNDAARYAMLKKVAVEKADDNREIYLKIKEPFIEGIIKKAS